MPLTLLQKIAQLTRNQEAESLIHAFFPFMRDEFPALQAIALYKVDNYQPEVVYGDDFKELQTEINELIQQILNTKAILSSQTKELDGLNLLVKKSSREKHCIYFMPYLLDQSCISEEQMDCIRAITDIYTNHQELISLNDRDPLTGLYNRKAFDQKILHLLNNGLHRRANDTELFSCFAIIDIDHFKQINDRFGHLYGDEVLLHFAQQAQAFFRQDDLVFRYGGEEFVVILQNVEAQSAKNVFERFRQHIENYHFPHVGQVTVSIGITRLDTSMLQSEIIDRADHALYYIKEHGRNNIACYETLVEEEKLTEIKVENDIELF